MLRFQLIQEARGRFRAALVTAPEADRDAIRRRLALRFESTFGEGTVLRVSFVDSLPRSPAGKTRPVISMAALDRAEGAGIVQPGPG
ncbi:MAG: hypothetical protein ACRDL6_08205 [Solirubrobacterales bacterium]